MNSAIRNPPLDRLTALSKVEGQSAFAVTLVELPALRLRSGPAGPAVSGGKPRGFTLVELLVVITIIVMLLALLTPALDRALYQAELAACGANLHGITQGLATYAMENKRAYPVRETIDRGDTTMERPNVLAIPDATSDAGNFAASMDGPLDDRPYLKGYIPLKALNCAVAGAVDLENTRDTSLVSSSYALWYGWRYEVAGERGLYRMGDRMTWQGEPFAYLASDLLVVESQNNMAWGSHPDDTDRMINRRTQDGNNAGDSQDAATDTEAYWLLTGTHRRGPVTANFAAADGSVRRYTDIHRDGETSAEEPRMSQVPLESGADGLSFPGQWIQLPRGN